MTNPLTPSDPAVPATPVAAGLPEPVHAAGALGAILRPVARLMIDHGLQLSAVVELLKQSLVDEALGAYGLADKSSTDTRVALLTGVHRKDVKRLRGGAADASAAVPMLPIAASVVARWISDPRFLNADQSARALARTPGRSLPGEPDFSALVAEVSSDVGARAVLDEMARLGVVDVRSDGYVALKSDAFLPQQGRAESFHFLAGNVGDHIAAAAHNLAPGRSRPLMLEQSAFAENLSEVQALQLHELARRLWQTALQQFLQTATVAEQRSEGAPGERRKLRFGVYVYEGPHGEGPPPVKPSAAKARRIPKKKAP